MATVQEIINLARIPVQDDAGTRFSNTKALGYVNAAVARAYQLRPDLRFGAYATPVAVLAVGDTFPLPAEMEQAVADYVTARLTAIEDEASATGRAAGYLALFDKAVTT